MRNIFLSGFKVVFIFCIFLDFCAPIKWLSLQHSNLHWNLTATVSNNPARGTRSGVRSPCGVARRRYGFQRLQAKLCRTSMESMPHVQAAAILAAQTCQRVFQDQRWNCSSITRAPYLMPDLARATKEQAYVYALSSAALTYTMAKACSSGALYHCTCASKPTDPPGKGFQWGGCSDNLQWGANFAKRFIDNVEKYNVRKVRDKMKREKNEGAPVQGGKVLKNEGAVVNLHNNKIGRKVISESLRTQCKCHGVSGSCSIKTCWRALPSMLDVGKKLLKRYSKAKEVSQKLKDENDPKIDFLTKDLIYLQKSANYCVKDEKLGSFGTFGRRCNVTSKDSNSCRQLCCGRGYRTVVEEKIERCQCKYYYCCYVKCKICKSTSLRYECS